MRKSDFRIRVSDILQASGQPQTEIFEIRREFRYKGSYVDFWIGLELCRRYGLSDLEKGLRSWKPVQEPVKEPAKEPELSEFIEITDFPVPVMVRRSDFRINATHIAKLTGRSRRTVGDLRKWLGSEKYTIVRGSKKHQGTYVDFDIGIEQCREYGLPELEKRLHSLRRTSEGPILEAESSHVEPRLPESDTVSARNESTRSRSIWNRDQPPTLPAGSISDGPIEAEDADEMDLGSDVAGSGDSVTSREPCPIQRNRQPVPSICCAKDAASSRKSGYDTKYSLLQLADPRSPSAKSVQYEVWDSRPQLSELTEVEPELRPSSWKTASHYGSLGDLFAPG